MSDFLDPSGEIQKHGFKIPHWQQDGVMQFVTFRLGDSLPASKLAAWQESRKIFLELNPSHGRTKRSSGSAAKLRPEEDFNGV